MKLYYNALKETTLFSVSIERVRQKIIEIFGFASNTFPPRTEICRLNPGRDHSLK